MLSQHMCKGMLVLDDLSLQLRSGQVGEDEPMPHPFPAMQCLIHAFLNSEAVQRSFGVTIVRPGQPAPLDMGLAPG